MNTKSIKRNLAICSLAVLLSSMSLHSAAENKDMMNDRDSDYKHPWMMGGGTGYGMMDGGMGYGMMGSGMGYGMMGSGMGYGMMGSGMGYGMMGSGMGYGMMGGDMGSCMMGSGMFDSGMMGRRAEILGMTDEQRATMRKITADLRHSNIQRISKIMDVHDQLAELYEKEPLDAKAIGSVYGQIFDLRQQMIEAGIEAKNKKRNVLNKK